MKIGTFFKAMSDAPSRPLEPLCGLCLSRDRRLSTLGSCYVIYKLMGGRHQNTSLLVCWECNSILKHIERFQHQVAKAENLLKSAHYPQPLSKLSLCIKNDYDGDFTYLDIIDNKVQWGCKSSPDVGVQTMSPAVVEPKMEFEVGCETSVDGGCIPCEVFITQHPNEFNKSKALIKEETSRLHTKIMKKEDMGKKMEHTMRMRKFRKKLRENKEKYQEHLEKERERVKIRSKTKKESMDNEQLGNRRKYNRDRQRLLRERKRRENKKVQMRLKEGCETSVDGGCISFEVFIPQYPNEFNTSKAPLKEETSRIQTKIMKKEDMGNNIPHTEVVESHADWVKRISKIIRSEKLSKRQHACLKCGLSFRTNKGIDKHIKQLHSKSPSGLPCVSCDCVAASADVLTAHSAQHRRLQCSVCNFTTQRVHTLRRHADTHLQQRIISCEVCGKQFRNRQHFLLHRATHTSNRRYECDDCGRVYTTRHQMFRHLRQHKKAFLCHICGKVFSTSVYLAAHSLAHEGETGRRFECGICRRRYVNKYKLEVHERFHTGEKPYACKVCTKKFRESAQLKAHCRKLHPETAEPIRRRIFQRTKSAFVNDRFTELKAVSGDYNDKSKSERTQVDEQRESKEHFCSFCGKMFTNRWSHEFHLAVHSNDRAYKCTECDSTFKYRSGLWTHKLVHKGEKPHKCTICGSQFTLKGNMTAHLKIHTDEKPFECTICGNKFRMKRNLKNHLKVHSSNESSFGVKLNSQSHDRKV